MDDGRGYLWFLGCTFTPGLLFWVSAGFSGIQPDLAHQLAIQLLKHTYLSGKWAWPKERKGTQGRASPPQYPSLLNRLILKASSPQTLDISNTSCGGNLRARCKEDEELPASPVFPVLFHCLHHSSWYISWVPSHYWPGSPWSLWWAAFAPPLRKPGQLSARTVVWPRRRRELQQEPRPTGTDSCSAEIQGSGCSAGMNTQLLKSPPAAPHFTPMPIPPRCLQGFEPFPIKDPRKALTHCEEGTASPLPSLGTLQSHSHLLCLVSVQTGSRRSTALSHGNELLGALQVWG